MAKIPLNEANNSVSTGSTGAIGPGEGITDFGAHSGSILGGGLENLAHGVSIASQAMKHQQLHLQALQKRQTDQDEALESAKSYSQLRTDWNQRLLDYGDSPDEDILNTATKEYDDYTSKMVENASSKNVRDELSLKSADYRLQFINQVHGIQLRNRQAAFGASFDKMLSNGEDSIFSAKSLDELQTQRGILNDAVDGAVKTGRIRDPETINALKSKANTLSLSWAEANLTDNPELVKAVVNGEKGYEGVMTGIPVRTREILLNKADTVINSNDQFDKVALHEALQSDIVQRIKTGEGKSLNLQRYEDAYGKSAREIAEHQLNDATRLHSVVEGAKGATNEDLAKLIPPSRPKADPTDPTYALQQKYADEVDGVITQAQSDKKDDAFTYFSQNPAIKGFADDYAKSPTADRLEALQHAVLEKQKLDKSLAPDDYKIMPKADAEKFIAQFNGLVQVGNKDDGAGVRDLLAQFSNQYKDDLPIALNQLTKSKGGETVTPLLNPLMWHLGNPTIFRLTLDALRKDPKEAYSRFETEKDKKNFLTDVGLDQNFLAYQASMHSTSTDDKTQSLVSGVREAYTAFARDYVLNGGNVKDASKNFFSNYTFGSSNGAVYARPVVFTDKLGNKHAMSDEQTRLSNNYLEYYPKTIDPSTIDPTTIVNQTAYFSSKDLTKDVGHALENNAFWSTTGDETGVYLFTKGSVPGAPKQVKDKQGNPIRVNFADTMTGINKIPFGQKPNSTRSNERTDDTWFEHLMNGLIDASR